VNKQTFDELDKKAGQLVMDHIKGFRKGLPDEMNAFHSFRVRDLVMRDHHWDDPDHDLFLAALLHDIVEDGGISLTELKNIGFSNRTVELVDLCSHDLNRKDSTERWVLMMARLIGAHDEDAWRIKLADLMDNLMQSRGLSEENRRFMVEVKAPLMLRLAKAHPFSRVITEEYPCVQPSIFALENEMLRQRADLDQLAGAS
jgi:(p)ppGpp synthase/HD superfamily hydrolase